MNTARNWKVEVVADNSGDWRSNGMLFAYELEARVYAIDLASRWTSVRDYRVVEVPVVTGEPEGDAA